MFDSITFEAGSGNRVWRGLDWGALAEATIFYDSVNVIVDAGSFHKFAAVVGPEILVHAIEAGYIKLFYRENMVGVMSSALDRTTATACRPVTASIERHRF